MQMTEMTKLNGKGLPPALSYGLDEEEEFATISEVMTAHRNTIIRPRVRLVYKG